MKNSTKRVQSYEKTKTKEKRLTKKRDDNQKKSNKKEQSKRKHRRFFYKVIFRGNNAKPIERALIDRLNWDPVIPSSSL